MPVIVSKTYRSRDWLHTESPKGRRHIKRTTHRGERRDGAYQIKEQMKEEAPVKPPEPLFYEIKLGPPCPYSEGFCTCHYDNAEIKPVYPWWWTAEEEV